MGENCQKPGRSVTKTGNSSTPITQMKPCNGCGLGVFQGRLRKFIYESLNYTPADKWKYHNDRVSILKDSAPPGYFTIFKEITGLVVDLIQADLTVNHKTVPDISVGLAWSKYWSENNLEKKYGKRTHYEHNYPDYYPQSMSNPQRPNAYPDAALPLFRQWFRQDYLLTKFPKYILTKTNVLTGGKAEALKIGTMYNSTALPKPPVAKLPSGSKP